MNDRFLNITADPEATQPPGLVPISTQESALSSTSKKDPLSDDAPPLRQGVKNSTLRANGISQVNGLAKGSCLRIPYFQPREETGPRKPIRDAGSEFYRDRLLNPPDGGPKYHQPKNTIPHAYFPNGAFDLINEQGQMIAAEGEFKALSLVEAGYAAIGIGGINNFAANGSLVGEIEFLFAQCEPRTIFFLGDADTTLNPQFSIAAIKFHRLVIEKCPSTTFMLPRMPLADLGRMKGIDDARDVIRHKDFESYMKNLLHSALVLKPGTSTEDLVYELINRERAGLKIIVHNSNDQDRQDILKKLTRIATACGPVRSDLVAQMAVDAGLVKKVSLFKQEQKLQARKDAEKRAETAEKIAPEMYYYPHGAKNYLYRTTHGSFTSVDRKGATNHLVTCGYMCKGSTENRLSETDDFLTALEARPIDWVGPLAGKESGMHTINQKSILVTRSPRLLNPVQGEYPVIRSFISGLFDYDPATDPNSEKQTEEAVNQSLVFYSWLALAVKDLYDGGIFSPAQALVLAGPKRVGKNVCQDIVTQCLGGRQASPFSAMSGETAFSGELLGAEHWLIADEQHGNGYKDKQKLQSSIKKFCVNQGLYFNAKHSEPINIDCYRRLTISLNNDAESLRVLPERTENGDDKLMILRAFRKHFHGEGTSFESFRDWWKVVLKELPALIYDLLHTFKIPEELHDRHYRVVSYHNPDLVEALQSTKPETAFAEIVRHLLVPQFQIDGTPPWRGTARTLIQELKERGASYIEGEDHYSRTLHVGRYLVALCKSMPDCFRRVGLVDGIATYEIGTRLPDSEPNLPDEFPPPLPPTAKIAGAGDLPPPPPPP